MPIKPKIHAAPKGDFVLPTTFFPVSDTIQVANAPVAHSTLPPSNAALNSEIDLAFYRSKFPNSRGQNVSIAIISTGIDAHHNYLLSTKIDHKFNSTQENQTDFIGQGTFLAGIVSTIAPFAKIKNVKVVERRFSASLKDVVKSFRWSIYHDRVDIILLPLVVDTDIYTPELRELIYVAYNKGITLIAPYFEGFKGRTSAVADDALVVSVGDKNNVKHVPKSNVRAIATLDSTLPKEYYAKHTGVDVAAGIVAGITCLAYTHLNFDAEIIRKKLFENRQGHKNISTLDILKG